MDVTSITILLTEGLAVAASRRQSPLVVDRRKSRMMRGAMPRPDALHDA